MTDLERGRGGNSDRNKKAVLDQTWRIIIFAKQQEQKIVQNVEHARRIAHHIIRISAETSVADVEIFCCWSSLSPPEKCRHVHRDYSLKPNSFTLAGSKPNYITLSGSNQLA